MSPCCSISGLDIYLLCYVLFVRGVSSWTMQGLEVAVNDVFFFHSLQLEMYSTSLVCVTLQLRKKTLKDQLCSFSSWRVDVIQKNGGSDVVVSS